MLTLDPPTAARIATIALGCVAREYPNQIAHAMVSGAEVGSPRDLHPAFFGCYDWHSAVHTHWCLARLLRVAPARPWAAESRGALRSSLTAPNLARELEYLTPEHRRTFERPYGLAWLLTLHAELRAWDDAEAAGWAASLAPLASLCAERLASWLCVLTHPVRSGVHSQSAFAAGLAIDWARAAGAREIETTIAGRARALYGQGPATPLALEPSGEDFLSPALGAADLLRRVMPAGEFAAWLDRTLPELGTTNLESSFTPQTPRDAADGRLAHLHGLNLSRAWMLGAIADALPRGDSRAGPLAALAAAHARAGLGAITDTDYARAHWLGSFAVYLLTGGGR